MNKNNIKVLFEGKYLEVNDNERIVLKSQIKDVKDASKVFTDQTYAFKIPASKTNNEILKHCLRTDIGSFDSSDSIDPRGYYDATIEVNGEVYTNGYLEIVDAEVKSGRVYSYSLRFIGRLAKLSRAFEDAKLIDLAGYFGKYNFPTRASVWYDLLTTDEGTDLPNTDETYWDDYDSDAVNANVRVFLNNLTENQLKFNDRASFTADQVNDTNELGPNSVNIAYTDWTTNSTEDEETRKGVKYNGFRVDLLRPSLRETAVLEALEDKFKGEVNLKFSRGLDSNGKPTSVDADVDTGKEHFFGSEEFKSSWMLLYSKNGGNKNRRQLYFENDWEPLTSNASGYDSSTAGAKGLLQWCSIKDDDLSNVSPYASLFYYGSDSYSDLYAEIDIDATPSNVPYKLTIEMGGEVLKTYDQTAGGDITKNNSVTHTASRNSRTTTGDLIAKGQDVYKFGLGCEGINVFVESDDEVEISGTINFQLLWKYKGGLFNNRTFFNKGNFENTISTIKSSTENFTVDTNLPNITIMDLLKGWQKSYNLVYYIDRDANDEELLVAEEYDKYIDTSDNGYSGAEIIDITQYVDTESYSIGKPTYYTEIDMGYEGRDTFLIREYDNSREFPYGTEQYEQRLALTNLAPRSKYEIEVPFELILLNSRTNSNASATDTTSVMFPYAWLVDNSRDQTDLKYFRHYASNESVGTDDAGLLGKDKDDTAFDEITTCNLIQLRRYDTSDNMEQSLLFSVNSDDSYSLEADDVDSPSLFNTYYKTFIENSFNKYAKLHKFRAYLDRSLLSKLSLNDTLIIGNDSYRINSYEVELGSGAANMELISTNKPQIQQSFKVAVEDGSVKNTIDIEEFYVTGGARKGDEDDFEFNIVADGGLDTLTYKWFKNDTEISGETGKTYTLTAANASNGDEVYCEVSDGTFTKNSSTIAIVIVTNTFTSITPSKTTLASAGETITLTVAGPANTGFEILTKDASPSEWIAPYQLNNGTYGDDIATDTALGTSGLEASANMKIIDSLNHIEIQTVWDETVFNSVFDADTTKGYYIKNTEEDYASDEEILYVPSTDDGGSWEQDEDGEVDTITWGTNKHIPTWLADLAFDKVVDGNTTTYYYNTTTWTTTKEVQTITVGGTNANVVVNSNNEVMRLHLHSDFSGGYNDGDVDWVFSNTSTKSASNVGGKWFGFSLGGININVDGSNETAAFGSINVSPRVQLPNTVSTYQDVWEAIAPSLSDTLDYLSWDATNKQMTFDASEVDADPRVNEQDIAFITLRFYDTATSTTYTNFLLDSFTTDTAGKFDHPTSISIDPDTSNTVYTSSLSNFEANTSEATSSYLKRIGAAVAALETNITYDGTVNSGSITSESSISRTAEHLTTTFTNDTDGNLSSGRWRLGDSATLGTQVAIPTTFEGYEGLYVHFYHNNVRSPKYSDSSKVKIEFANGASFLCTVTAYDTGTGQDNHEYIQIGTVSDTSGTVPTTYGNMTYTVRTGAPSYLGGTDGGGWFQTTSREQIALPTTFSGFEGLELTMHFTVDSLPHINPKDSKFTVTFSNGASFDFTYTNSGSGTDGNYRRQDYVVKTVSNTSGTLPTDNGFDEYTFTLSWTNVDFYTGYIDIDMGTTTAINHSATITAGGGQNAQVEVDGLNGNEASGMHTTITVYDYSNTEVTSFTQSSSSLTDDKSGDVVTAIKDAINNNEETPIDFGATESGKVVTATADVNGYVDGKWRVTINNHGQTTNAGTLTATVATTTEGSDSGQIDLAKRTVVGTTGTTDDDGAATVSLYVGPNDGDADRTFKVELINQDLYSDTVESATITQNDPD